MSIPLNQNALLQFLNQKDFHPLFQKETDQTYLVMNIGEYEVPLFFLIRSENSLLQTLAYLPYQLQEKTLGETARLLHLLNKELDMPGFGLDEKEDLMFYRCVIPCVDGKISEELLLTYISCTRLACETFMGAIGTILSGSASIDELLKGKNE